jgi:RHS repeat-associated protein
VGRISRWLLAVLAYSLAAESAAVLAPVTVYGPEKLTMGLGTKTVSRSFTLSQPSATGILFLTNGNGTDFPKLPCKTLKEKLACVVSEVKEALDRPEKVEITLNGKVILTQAAYNQDQGHLALPVNLISNNQLSVKLIGVPFSSITVEVKANTVVQNLPPVAQFSFSPTTGIAPEIFTFNALLSSDPDGTITSYDWDFGDGQFATGSLVVHNYQTSGTFAAKLKVTDNQGSTNTKTQNVLVRANQLPLAKFVSASDSSLGVYKARFDASSSTDADGTILEYSWEFGDGQTGTGALAEHIYAAGGTYLVKLTVKDNKQGLGAATQSLVLQDTVAPVIALQSPAPNSTIKSLSVSIAGSSNEPLSQVLAQFDSEGPFQLILSNDKKSFSGSIQALKDGARTISITSKDLAGNSVLNSVSVTLDTNVPPVPNLLTTIPPSNVAPLMVLFDGSKSTSPQAKALHYEFDFGDGDTATSANGIVSHQFKTAGTFTVTMTVIDTSGSRATAQTQIQATNPLLPPIASTQAPPLSQTTVQPMIETVKFLYEGPNAIQTGVADGAIDSSRVAVVQGTVVDEDSQPLSGVKISILGNPEVGQTITTGDGKFHIAVNGGALLTVKYERNGYFPVQRKVATQSLDYFRAEDIVMIKPDSKVTQVTLGSDQIQVVKGSKVVDQSGERTAIMALPAGVQAHLEMPDGSTKALSTLTLRATEYTVGANGPAKMPGPLPPTTSYTYAVELSADEAIAAGAEHVRFSKPVPFYVDNFIGLPVGKAVPYGTYNYKTAAWDAELDGIILKVIDIQNGQAVLDSTGSGAPGSAQMLAQLNITTEELGVIGQSFQVGQSFWRVQMEHLTPNDLNYPLSSPLAGGGTGNDTPTSGNPDDCPQNTCSVGSIIGVNDQSLGEVIDVPGMPSVLSYNSTLMSGNKVSHKLSIPLVRNTNQGEEVLLKIDIAGQHYEQTFASSNNLKTNWVWDGKDGFGRELQQATNARVTIEYLNGAFYLVGNFVFNLKSFSAPALSRILSAVPGRATATFTKVYNIPIGRDYRHNTNDIGGWSFDQVHHYNPVAKALYLGNGEVINASNLTSIISPIIGSGIGTSPKGDGGLALAANTSGINSLAVAPDGSIYIGESTSFVIRKVGTDGIINTVVGTGVSGSGGQGTIGTSTPIRSVRGMEVGADGTLYFVDSADQKIRKLTPDGLVFTVAGTGSSGFSGDGGPATLAQISNPEDLAIASDGTIYFTDVSNRRVRQISTNGLIRTIAGHDGGDGLEEGKVGALQASFSFLSGIAFVFIGDIFVSDFVANRVRIIHPDGTVEKVAGTTQGYSGDSGPALAAQLKAPKSLAVSSDGTLYVADTGNNRIRKVTSDGMIDTFVGEVAGSAAFSKNQAIQQSAVFPGSIKFYRKNSLLIADTGYRQARLVQPPLPEISASGYTIGSRDGTEVFQFSSTGEHLRTLFAKTGAVKWAFSYDAAGRLNKMTDANGNQTVINRDSIGYPTSLVGAFGMSIPLSTNSDGFLSSLSLPTGETTKMTYFPSGMLSSFMKPKGNTSTFEYNAMGELTKDSDSSGGFKTLARVDDLNQFTVTQTSAMGRVTQVKVDSRDFFTRRFESSTPDLNVLSQTASKSEIQVRSNQGSIQQRELDIDPRLAGITQKYTWSLATLIGPSELTKTSTSYTPLSPTDFFKFVQVDEVDKNGFKVTSTYDSRNKSITTKTIGGQQTFALLDAQERPVQVVSNGLELVSYTYTARGQIASMKVGDRLTQYSYDLNGRIAAVTDPLGQVKQYAWDTSNRLVRETRNDSKFVNYTYDLNSNMSGLQPPDSMIHQFASNLLDLFSVYTPPGVGTISTETSYTYNLDRQLVKETKPDGTVLQYTYNTTDERLTKVTGSLKSIIYDFQSSSPRIPASSISSDGITLNVGAVREFQYQRVYSGQLVGKINYFLANNQQLDSVYFNQSPIATYAYNVDRFMTQAGHLSLTRDPLTGAVTSTQLGIVQQAYSYNTFRELAGSNASINGSSLLATQYTRDKLGRVTSKIETISGVTKTYGYSYDSVGRLSSVSIDGVLTNQYTYDSNGNRIAMNGIAASYDAQDRLIQYGDINYTFNPNGHLTQKQKGTDVTKYVYDDFGQLAKVTLSNGKIIDYLIDGEIHRVVKKVDGVIKNKFIYGSNGMVAAELNLDNSVKSIFVYGTQSHSPDYMVQGSLKYYFVKDQLGSVRFVVDSANGAVVQYLNYDEFGNVLQDTNPGLQPFGFAGGLYDIDTKLVRFGARDYDPETGRFTSKDPVLFNGRQTNLYSYLMNDPINMIDPSGLWGITIGGSIGGFLGGGFDIAGGVYFGFQNGSFFGGGYGSGGSGFGVGAGAGVQGTFYPDACNISGASTAYNGQVSLITGNVVTSQTTGAITGYGGGIATPGKGVSMVFTNTGTIGTGP